MLIIALISQSVLYSQSLWKTINAGTGLDLNTVSFGSDLVGYIGADDSTILKTIDGGKTWFNLSFTGITFTSQLPDVTYIEFINDVDGKCIVANSDTIIHYTGGLYLTNDGGLTWTSSFSMCTPIKTYSFSDDDYLIIGSSCFGGKTIDIIKDSSLQNTVYHNWGSEILYAIDFIDTLTGIVGGDSGQVYRTYDGGLSWDTVQTCTNNTILDLKYVNDSLLYGAVENELNTMIFSNDGGLTWQFDNNSLTFFYPTMKDLDVSKKHQLVAVGESSNSNQGVIYWQDTVGNFWQYDTDNKLLNALETYGDSTIIVVGDSGKILINKDFSTSIKEENISKRVVLYPNPTTNHFSIKTKGVDNIKMNDLFGREIMISKRLDNTYLFNQVSSGIYYVTGYINQVPFTKTLVVE